MLKLIIYYHSEAFTLIILPGTYVALKLVGDISTYMVGIIYPTQLE